MEGNIIDAHIHLDHYKETELKLILDSMREYKITSLIAVSEHLASAEKTFDLAKKYKHVHPAFGFHPEQKPPNEKELVALMEFITKNQHEMVAIGEVGLPYYLRREEESLQLEEYTELLEQFIILAKELDKPIILHAIYENAPIVCTLLEKHSIEKAHFHWFKGDAKTLNRMKENGYYLSVTPDIVYEQEIQDIAEMYPLNLLMVETDGPWPFEGPFKNQLTHPKMIHESMRQIAHLKKINRAKVYDQIYLNTKEFYKI